MRICRITLCVILAKGTLILFELPCRIVIIGTSCSGKTIFARKLANSLSIDHIELDQLYWRKNWKGAPLHEFRIAVDAATDRPSWVVDGNYSKVRETFVQSFLSKDSIILWMLKTFHRRKKQYPILFQDPNNNHLNVIRLRCAEDEQKLLQATRIRGQDYA